MKKILSLLSSFVLVFMMSTAFANTTTQDMSNTMEDSKITTEVKSSLLKNQLVNGADYNTWTIHVTTNNGVVHLTGHVKTEAEKAKALEVVNSIEGVKSVQNDLEIKP